MTKKYAIRLTWVLLFGLALSIYVFVALNRPSKASQQAEETMRSRERAEEYMAFNKSIILTPEQQTIYAKALSGLPAPCCSDRSALTCCCECNMARTWWGLSKHVIVDEGYGPEEVRTAVTEWFDSINPDGFTGDACHVGACARPFRNNGCGGMDERTITY